MRNANAFLRPSLFGVKHLCVISTHLTWSQLRPSPKLTLIPEAFFRRSSCTLGMAFSRRCTPAGIGCSVSNFSFSHRICQWTGPHEQHAKRIERRPSHTPRLAAFLRAALLSPFWQLRSQSFLLLWPMDVGQRSTHNAASLSAKKELGSRQNLVRSHDLQLY